MTPEIGKVLLAAADYIELHGWCQHSYRRPTGEVCLVEAIWEGAKGSTVPGATSVGDRKLYDEARTVMLHKGPGVETWNDAPGRTKEEVVAALREVGSRL